VLCAVCDHVYCAHFYVLLQSALIPLICDSLTARKCRYAKTASTGMAAIAIGGHTIHSWAGVGNGKGSIHELESRALRKGRSAKYGEWFSESWNRWLSIDALIIDEVSMLDAGLWDALATIGESARSRPGRVQSQRACWGGLQLIVFGDFHQLPPVPDKDGPPPRFAFQSKFWDATFDYQIVLDQIYRQDNLPFLRYDCTGRDTRM
jgi:ATP-dependent DNA helicase PIF1